LLLRRDRVQKIRSWVVLRKNIPLFLQSVNERFLRERASSLFMFGWKSVQMASLMLQFRHLDVLVRIAF
jgi:hypothetical protein